VLEAGLGFAVKPGKGDFIGRDAVLRKRDAGLSRRLLQFRLEDPEPMLFHNEAVVRDGRIVSIVTSGNYGHALGGAIGMGYVPCPGESAEEVLASTYEIEIAGRRHRAVASLRPMYDPRPKGCRHERDRGTDPAPPDRRARGPDGGAGGGEGGRITSARCARAWRAGSTARSRTRTSCASTRPRFRRSRSGGPGQRARLRGRDPDRRGRDPWRRRPHPLPPRAGRGHAGGGRARHHAARPRPGP
jgi:hypothetical protein